MSARPITDTLRHIGGGVFIDVASDKLAELVAAVDASGKSGKIDLSITVKKATRGGAMHITGKVLEAATQTLIAQIREKTGNPFFFGVPFAQ